MAPDSEILSASPNAQIFRHQFDALRASHKAFHEVAIKVTSILEDPSRYARYQSIPASEAYNLDGPYTDTEQSVLSKDYHAFRAKRDNITYSSQLRSQLSQKNANLRVDACSESSFNSANWKARKAYRQKRQRSHKLFAPASTSYRAAEYDFQCKAAYIGRLLNGLK